MPEKYGALFERGPGIGASPDVAIVEWVVSGRIGSRVANEGFFGSVGSGFTADGRMQNVTDASKDAYYMVMTTVVSSNESWTDSVSNTGITWSRSYCCTK